MLTEKRRKMAPHLQFEVSHFQGELREKCMLSNSQRLQRRVSSCHIWRPMVCLVSQPFSTIALLLTVFLSYRLAL